MSSGRVKTIALLVIFGGLAVCLCAAAVAAQTDPSASAPGAAGASAPTATNQLAILVTTIAGVVSMLATQFFSMYRENRNRKWDLQDRAAARDEMRKHVETQRVETLQTAIELARVSNINREHLSGAIEQNTALTIEAGAKAEAAYTSANNFNAKFEALHKELAEMAKKLPPEVGKEK